VSVQRLTADLTPRPETAPEEPPTPSPLLKGKAVTLLKVQLAASALAELRGGERAHARRVPVELASGA